MTIKEIVLKFKEELKIKTSISAVHRILHKLNLSYITRRPVYYKQEKKTHKEFKKKSKKNNKEKS